MADASVRRAEASDARAITEVQAAAWREAYSGSLPDEVLDAIGSATAVGVWRDSVTSPPSPRHRVLVALAGPAVVGLAAYGPAGDPDLDPDEDAELLAMCVAPGATGQGHGSRLVNASVDHLREDGFRRAHTWVAVLGAADESLRRFLEGAGWGADGAHRRLDLDGGGTVIVPQVRLTTALGEGP